MDCNNNNRISNEVDFRKLTVSPPNAFMRSSSGFKSSNGTTSIISTTGPKLFGQRNLRSETRSKAKDEINQKKAIITTMVQVKKWEKRLVSVGDSTLVLYRWVPMVVNQNKHHV